MTSAGDSEAPPNELSLHTSRFSSSFLVWIPVLTISSWLWCIEYIIWENVINFLSSHFVYSPPYVQFICLLWICSFSLLLLSNGLKGKNVPCNVIFTVGHFRMLHLAKFYFLVFLIALLSAFFFPSPCLSCFLSSFALGFLPWFLITLIVWMFAFLPTTLLILILQPGHDSYDGNEMYNLFCVYQCWASIILPQKIKSFNNYYCQCYLFHLIHVSYMYSIARSIIVSSRFPSHWIPYSFFMDACDHFASALLLSGDVCPPGQILDWFWSLSVCHILLMIHLNMHLIARFRNDLQWPPVMT